MEFLRRTARLSPNLALSSSLRSSLLCLTGAAILSIPFTLIREVWLNGHLTDVDSTFGNLILGGELFAWMGLFIALEKGGYFLLDHFEARYLLRRNDLLPWDVVKFLDTAVERLFLRRVGGGYIFVHRTLLEYFANTTKGSDR
jgi:hypothetical protein